MVCFQVVSAHLCTVKRTYWFDIVQKIPFTQAILDVHHLFGKPCRQATTHQEAFLWVLDSHSTIVVLYSYALNLRELQSTSHIRYNIPLLTIRYTLSAVTVLSGYTLNLKISHP